MVHWLYRMLSWKEGGGAEEAYSHKEREREFSLPVPLSYFIHAQFSGNIPIPRKRIASRDYSICVDHHTSSQDLTRSAKSHPVDPMPLAPVCACVLRDSAFLVIGVTIVPGGHSLFV